MGLIERILFGGGAASGRARGRGAREWVLQAVVRRIRQEALEFADRAASPEVVMHVRRIKLLPVSARAAAALEALFDANINPATAVAAAVRGAVERARVPRVRLDARCAIDPLPRAPAAQESERIFDFDVDDDEFDIQVEYQGQWEPEVGQQPTAGNAGTLVAEVDDELGRRTQNLSLERLPIWFGRSDECFVRLQGRFACHKGLALVRGTDNRLELLHRRSTNGVWVNRRPLETGQAAPLEGGQTVIEFGYGVNGKIERSAIEANAASGDRTRFPRVVLLSPHTDPVTPLPRAGDTDAPTPMPASSQTVCHQAVPVEGADGQPVGRILIETSEGRRVERVFGKALIGRVGDIVAAGRAVSKRHLELRVPTQPRGPWLARDLSTNGTYSNGKLLTKGQITALPDQTELVLGGPNSAAMGVATILLGG